MSLIIRALGVGQVLDVPLASLTHGQGWGETVEAAMIMFVIEGGSSPILVDTGTASPEATEAYHHHRIVRPAEADPRAVLARAGYEPQDFEIVVNTHLHWDHCANNHLFTRARFVVQQRELAYAVDPLPMHRRAYEKLPGLQAPWMATWDRIETVSGDQRIAEGVSVVALPGHSPGSQGVLVETAAGPYLIAGDTLDLYANWEGTSSVRHIPSGIHTDLFEYTESFAKIEDLDCEVIPSHDPKVLVTGTFG